MGRIYRVPMDRVSVSAVQDLFEITAAAGKTLAVRAIIVENTNLETSEQLALQIKHGTSGTTSGTGGTASTPTKTDQNDPAAGFVAEINNTTQAVVGTGVLTVLEPRGWNQLSGFSWRAVPREEITVLFSERVIVSLPVAPAAAVVLSGVVVVEEF